MASKQTLIDERTIQLKVEMDQLVENIKELDVEIKELDQLFKARAELLKEQFEEKKMGLEQKKEKYEQYLRELFEQVPQSETKTQRKVKLLNGDVVMKKAKLDFEKDTDKLLVWAQMNGRNDLINKKEVLSFKWADFKKDLVLTEDGYMWSRMKTTGKKLNKLVPESKFNVVLLAKCKDGRYIFETHSRNSTAKTSLDAFEEDEIENDIVPVLKVLEEY